VSAALASRDAAIRRPTSGVVRVGTLLQPRTRTGKLIFGQRDRIDFCAPEHPAVVHHHEALGRRDRDGTQSTARTPPGRTVEPEFLGYLPAACGVRRLLCLHSPTRQVPGVPVHRETSRILLALSTNSAPVAMRLRGKDWT
jgi:hypothetical protein